MKLFDCPGAKSTYLHAAAEVRLTLEDGDLEVGATFVRFPSLTAQKPRLLHLLTYLVKLGTISPRHPVGS